MSHACKPQFLRGQSVLSYLLIHSKIQDRLYYITLTRTKWGGRGEEGRGGKGRGQTDTNEYLIIYCLLSWCLLIPKWEPSLPAKEQNYYPSLSTPSPLGLITFKPTYPALAPCQYPRSSFTAHYTRPPYAMS